MGSSIYKNLESSIIAKVMMNKTLMTESINTYLGNLKGFDDLDIDNGSFDEISPSVRNGKSIGNSNQINSEII